MTLRCTSLLVGALLAGAAVAGDAPPLAAYPIGSTLAIASVLGDQATDLRSGPLVQRANIHMYRAPWDLDARIAALLKSELERNGRFRTVPLALDAAQFTDLPDIGLKPPRSANLQGKVRGQVEDLGPATGAAAYLIVGRATLPNDLNQTTFDLGGYGLYRLREVKAFAFYGQRGDYTSAAYARLRLHLIDAKRLRNLANRTISISVPVGWIAFDMPFKSIGEHGHASLSESIVTSLDAELGAVLGSMGLDAPPAAP